MSRQKDLNPRHPLYKSGALPTELCRLIIPVYYQILYSFTNNHLSVNKESIAYILLNLKELKTTLILLKAIATAAKIGFNSMPKNGYKRPAATGIKAML